jgi:hypothetical protein
VSTNDFVAAAQEALAEGEPLGLVLTALDAETWGTSNNSNLNLRFRSDDATTGQRPTLTVQYTHFPTQGDYNLDEVVDAADYVLWRKNPLGIYGSAEYQVWRANFGDAVLPAGAPLPAPEPATGTFCVTMTAMFLMRFHRSRE